MKALELTVIQHLANNGWMATYEVMSNGEVIDVESDWDDAKTFCTKLALQSNVGLKITLVI